MSDRVRARRLLVHVMAVLLLTTGLSLAETSTASAGAAVTADRPFVTDDPAIPSTRELLKRSPFKAKQLAAPVVPTAEERNELRSDVARSVNLPTTQQFTAASRTTYSGGAARVELYARPEFKRTARGWSRLSGRLARVRSHALRARRALLPATFSTRGSRVLDLTAARSHVGFELRGATLSRPRVAVNGRASRITYRSVYPGVNLRYDVYGNQIKESFVLKTPAVRRAFVFDVSDPGHTLGAVSPAPNGGFDFSGQVAPETTMSLLPPAAWPSHQPRATSPRSSESASTATQTVTPTSQGFRVKLALSDAWAAEQEFPVVLDPSLVYRYSDGNLTSGSASGTTTACSGSPCPLLSNADGSTWLPPDTGRRKVAYYHVDLSNLSAKNVDSAELSVGWNYGTSYAPVHAETELRAVNGALPANPTGADVVARESTTPIPEVSKDEYTSPMPKFTRYFDVTEPVRNWIKSGTGATAGFAQQITPKGYAGSFYPGWSDYTSTATCSADAYASEDYCYYSPTLAIDYLGTALPPPIPVEQTWGCTCRFGSGAGSISREGDPVSTGSGHLIEHAVDLTTQAAGVPISMTRTYNGQDTTNGVMGVGWTHEYDTSLTVATSTGIVTFKDPTGGREVFRPQSGGGYLGDPGVTAVLTTVTGGWTLRSPSGEVLTFNSYGQETSDRDPNGQGVALTYTGTGATAKIKNATDAAGHVATFTFGTNGANNGKITQVATDDGRTVKYGYTTVAGASRLTTVTAPDTKVTTYKYSTTGVLTGVKDPTAATSANNVYDSTTGRITKQTDAAGNVTNFSWTASTVPGDPAGTGVETTTDSNGDVIGVDSYYGNVLIKHTDGENNTTNYGYDPSLNLVWVQNPRGYLTSMTYDARGNLLTKTPPGRGSGIESWTYDAHNNITAHTDSAGQTTTYVYDATDNLTSTTDPLSHTTNYTYNSAGQVLTVQTPKGLTTTYTYTTKGQVASQTSPGNHKTTYTYDAAGNLASTVDPRGNLTGATAANFTTTYAYDANRRLLATTDPRGTITRNTYDAAGHLTETTVTDSASRVLQDTLHTYDGDGRTLTTTNVDQTTATNSYDLRGRLASATDGEGGQTTYSYDRANRLTRKITPGGHGTGADPALFSWYYQYDPDGNLVATTDRDGHTSTVEYDALDRPIVRTSPLGNTARTTYDQIGRQTSVTDGLGQTTQMAYDPAGRLTGIALPGQYYTQYQYDADGLKTTATSPSGTSKATWTYDADGNVATTTDPLGNLSGATASQHMTSYTYDAAGNKTTATDPLNHTTTWTYDGDNNQTSTTTARGYVTAYGYDGLNRVTTVTPPALGGTASPATTYTYDKYGNLSTKSNGRSQAWTYRYNTNHQISEILDPLGRSRSYAYNAEGDLAGYFGGRAHAPGADASQFYVYPVHDQYHRLVGIVTPDNESTSWYDYDADGNLDSTSDDILGISTYTHDAAGQLTNVNQSSGTFAYSYDPAGNVLTRDYQYGAKLTYQYNGDGLATQLTENDHQNTPATTTFGYDADQALTSITYPASTGIAETRTYNAAEQLATVQTKSSAASAPLSKFTYTRDADGNPTQIGTTRGPTTTNATYAYDSWDRLSTWCPGVASCTGAADRVDYGYDPASNLTTENRQGTVPNPGSITNTFDTADQLTSRATTVAGTTTTSAYTYDYDGNLTTGGRTWNLLNQLTASDTAGTGATSYTYDALNNRRTATTGTGTGANAQVRRVLWDINNPIPMPALIVEPNNDTTTEVYAPDTTLLESRHLYRAYDADYYGHDAQGSITDAFKPGGTPTWANTYDPWGAQAAHTPLTSDAIDNYFGYTGAYTEPTTGDLALRARDYNPTRQRFNNIDSVTPDLTAPLASTYAYANNQPGVLTDPTGMCPWCVGAVVGAIGGAITGGVIYAATTDNFSWSGLAGAAGTGAVAGAIIGGTLGVGTSLVAGATATEIAGTLATGATIGAVTSVATDVALGYATGNGLPSSGDLVHSAWTGAAIGAVVPALPLLPKIPGVVRALCSRGGKAATDTTRAAETAPEVTSGLERTGTALSKSDAFHRSVSWVVDNPAAQRFAIKGGDGVSRELYQLPGEVNGKSGVFEWIIDRSGTNPVINHQRFIPGGSVTGYPNQVVP